MIDGTCVCVCVWRCAAAAAVNMAGTSSFFFFDSCGKLMSRANQLNLSFPPLKGCIKVLIADNEWQWCWLWTKAADFLQWIKTLITRIHLRWPPKVHIQRAEKLIEFLAAELICIWFLPKPRYGNFYVYTKLRTVSQSVEREKCKHKTHTCWRLKQPTKHWKCWNEKGTKK